MPGISTSLIGDLNGVSSALQGHAGIKGTEPGTSFANVLSDALEQYNQIDNVGDNATLKLLAGNTDDLSGTLIATEKAEIALNLTVAIRNKAVDAYKEIMNMQV